MPKEMTVLLLYPGTEMEQSQGFHIDFVSMAVISNICQIFLFLYIQPHDRNVISRFFVIGWNHGTSTDHSVVRECDMCHVPVGAFTAAARPWGILFSLIS